MNHSYDLGFQRLYKNKLVHTKQYGVVLWQIKKHYTLVPLRQRQNNKKTLNYNIVNILNIIQIGDDDTS